MNGQDKPLKTLIFSVSIGSGHDNAAKALAEKLLEERPGSEAKIIDTFQYINATLHKVVVGSYMETLKFTPKVWGYLYDQAAEGERFIDLGQLMSKLLSLKLERLLKQFDPDVILTSHAFPTGILSVMKEKGHIKVPIASVVTDFHVHNFWIHQGIDRYFIPAPDLSHRLLQHGIEEAKIISAGLPLRSQFLSALDTGQAKAELGLDTQLTSVLVMGGGLGLGHIEQIAEKILADSNFQVIVVAGKNKVLHNHLSRIYNPNMKVYGYVENMAQVIAASDMVVSKPGGVTTAEVLAMRKPLIIFSSLPGQEDRNTEYLLNKGAAIKVRKLDLLLPEIKSFWHNPVRKRHVLEISEQLGIPDASRLIWKEILSVVEK